MQLTEEECEKAVEEVCKLCHEINKLRYGQEALGCAFQSFDNDYCDKVKIFKQLIKEHFELVEKYNEIDKENIEQKKRIVFWKDDLCGRCKLKSNPPLKFEELHENMWVWDNKDKYYFKIDTKSEEKNKLTTIMCGQLIRIFFEENRFYLREVKGNV